MSVKPIKLTQEEEKKYKRLCLHSQIRSLLWGVFKTKNDRNGYTLKQLANDAGYTDITSQEYFVNNLQLTIDEIADFAEALNVELRIEAHERSTDEIFTPSGQIF